jgi:hypothetical protein
MTTDREVKKAMKHLRVEVDPRVIGPDPLDTRAHESLKRLIKMDQAHRDSLRADRSIFRQRQRTKKERARFHARGHA